MASFYGVSTLYGVPSSLVRTVAADFYRRYSRTNDSTKPRGLFASRHCCKTPAIQLTTTFPPPSSSFSPASGAIRGETPLSYLFPFLIYFPYFIPFSGINPRRQRFLSFSLCLVIRLGKKNSISFHFRAKNTRATRSQIESKKYFNF